MELSQGANPTFIRRPRHALQDRLPPQKLIFVNGPQHQKCGIGLLDVGLEFMQEALRRRVAVLGRGGASGHGLDEWGPATEAELKCSAGSR